MAGEQRRARLEPLLPQAGAAVPGQPHGASLRADQGAAPTRPASTPARTSASRRPPSRRCGSPRHVHGKLAPRSRTATPSASTATSGIPGRPRAAPGPIGSAAASASWPRSTAIPVAPGSRPTSSASRSACSTATGSPGYERPCPAGEPGPAGARARSDMPAPGMPSRPSRLGPLDLVQPFTLVALEPRQAARAVAAGMGSGDCLTAHRSRPGPDSHQLVGDRTGSGRGAACRLRALEHRHRRRHSRRCTGATCRSGAAARSACTGTTPRPRASARSRSSLIGSRWSMCRTRPAAASPPPARPASPRAPLPHRRVERSATRRCTIRPGPRAGGGAALLWTYLAACSRATSHLDPALHRLAPPPPPTGRSGSVHGPVPVAGRPGAATARCASATAVYQPANQHEVAAHHPAGARQPRRQRRSDAKRRRSWAGSTGPLRPTCPGFGGSTRRGARLLQPRPRALPAPAARQPADPAAHLVGFSMGGGVVLQLEALAPGAGPLDHDARRDRGAGVRAAGRLPPESCDPRPAARGAVAAAGGDAAFRLAG